MGNIQNKIAIIWLTALLLCIGTFVTQAQNKQAAKEVVNDFFNTLDSGRKQEAVKIARPVPGQEPATGSENAAYDSIRFSRELKRADFAAYHQQRSFAWQYYSSICIFIMVMLIVGMGLVLSFKQFQLTEKQVRANLTKTKEETTTVEGTNSDIEISQTGLKINTGVIGLAILFLSLAFFFLYLKYVYGISVVDTGN